MILALCSALSVISFLAVFFAVRRLCWRYSAEGRLYRLLNSRINRLKKAASAGDQERSRISKKKDRQNIEDLLNVIYTSLNQHKEDIPIDVLVRAQLTLNDCRRELDFEKALRIHDAIFAKEPRLLNDALKSQMS